MSAPEQKIIKIKININKNLASAATEATATTPVCHSHREQVLIVNQLFLEIAHPLHPFYKSLL